MPSGAIQRASQRRTAVGVDPVHLIHQLFFVTDAIGRIQRIDALPLVGIVQHRVAHPQIRCRRDGPAERGLGRVLAAAVVTEPVGVVLQFLGKGAGRGISITDRAVRACRSTGVIADARTIRQGYRHHAVDGDLRVRRIPVRHARRGGVIVKRIVDVAVRDGSPCGSDPGHVG